MAMKAYKYRIYPNKATAEKLQWTLDCCRDVYNAAVQERRDMWNIIKRHPNYYDLEWRKRATKEHGINYYSQSGQMSEIKELCPEYKGIYSTVFREPLQRVDRAFKAFFRRVKNGEKAGYPRFKGKNWYNSFTFPDTTGFSLTEDNRLCLAKIGAIKVKLHRPVEGKIKTCTIKREGDCWYVVFACEVEAQRKMPYTDDEIGIDLGLLHFATLSTGDTIDNPRYYRKSEQKLARAQQALSRKKRGSKRRKKAVQCVAKHHRKIRNQRKDFLHKQARQLVDTYTVIVFEDIKPGNLSRAPKPKQDTETGQYLPNGASAKAGLNKSILDAGWGQFITLCESKAESAGTVQVIRVDPKYTSQMCSRCGTIRKKTLDERWHSCECGLALDRDHNAAINILALGRRVQVA